MARNPRTPSAKSGPASLRLRAASLAALSLLSPLATAAPAQPPGAFTTRVRFINDTPHRRVQWATATVPFPEGLWTPGKTFAVPGALSDLVPFGARWNDGSVRFAQLAVLLDLDPWEERVVDVVEARPPAAGFELSGWVARGLQSFDVGLFASLPNGRASVADLRIVSVQADGAFRRLVHCRDRLPRTDLVYDLWLEFYAFQDHVPFELRITNSRAGSSNWEQRFQSLDLVVTGAAAALRAPHRRGVRYGPVSNAGPNIVHLMGRDGLWDGQGQEWVGALLFHHPTGQPSDGWRAETLAAVVEEPLMGVSTDWRRSRAFGPFRYVPPPPPWVRDGGRASQLAERRAFEQWRQQPGSWWDDWPLGMRYKPSLTGDQHDFGAAKILDVFASGMPYGIEEARLNASEEALRPVHHREAGGVPVLSSRHPSWVTWDGRTHFNTTVSPDRLGKPEPQPPISAHSWLGRDNEHWSSLTLAAAYLLTKSPALRYELDNEAELWIAGHTLPSQKPGWSTNGIGAARAVGRSSLSMAWNYLCTGRTDLRDHLAARAREVVAQQAVAMSVAGPVRPIVVTEPDPRLLMREMWRPWEEAQAILGLEAIYRVTGEPAARRVAAVAAKNLLRWGWKTTATETIVATAVGWLPGGQPLSPRQYADPTWVLWSYGTAFSEWSLPAVKLAVRYGLEYGDAALVNRAAYIWAELAKGRTSPSSGGWDRFSEWDAVQ